MVHCLSDVWLDHPDTFRALDALFAKCVSAAQAPSYASDDVDGGLNIPLPKLFIFCGNFSTQGVAQGTSKEMQDYQGMSDSYFDFRELPQLKDRLLDRGLRSPGRSDCVLSATFASNTFRLRAGSA